MLRIKVSPNAGGPRHDALVTEGTDDSVAMGHEAELLLPPVLEVTDLGLGHGWLRRAGHGSGTGTIEWAGSTRPERRGAHA